VGNQLNVPEKITEEYIQKLINELKEGKILQLSQMNQILKRIKKILDDLPNCIYIDRPQKATLSIVGYTWAIF
jgi:hypothetical protein